MPLNAMREKVEDWKLGKSEAYLAKLNCDTAVQTNKVHPCRLR